MQQEKKCGCVWVFVVVVIVVVVVFGGVRGGMVVAGGC